MLKTMAGSMHAEAESEGEFVCHPTRTRVSKVPDTDFDSSLQVNVLFTKPEATLSALNVAGRLAKGLDARIRLIVPQVVPFPLQLARPPVDAAFTVARARDILCKSHTDARILVCLCRERLQAALAVLQPHSLLLMGGRTRFWPTEDSRLAKQIQGRGHQVLFINQG